jgi:hypothetical protein
MAVTEAQPIPMFLCTLSPHLFWDCEVEALDPEQHAPRVIQRVLELGTYADWQAIKSYYTLERIAAVAVNARGLDPRAATFVACVAGVPKEQFRCFMKKPSPDSCWKS